MFVGLGISDCPDPFGGASTAAIRISGPVSVTPYWVETNLLNADGTQCLGASRP
jgi:hypothetical protein